MKMYVLNDTQRFMAATDAELVHRIHLASRSPCDDDATYMREFSERSRLYDRDQIIRHDTPENFIADLMSLGLLRVEGVH